MANLMADSVDKAKGFILIIWPITFVLLLIGLRLGWEDTQTTIAGYKTIQTAKVGDTDQLGLMVALLFQLAPIALLYWYARNTKNTAVLIIGLACLGADIFYDVSFKVTGFGGNPTWGNLATTITESMLIYTLGSEVLVTWCAGFLWEGLDEFGSSLVMFVPSVIGLIAKLLDGTLTGGGKIVRVIEKHAPNVSLGNGDDTPQVVVNGKPQEIFGKRRD